MTEILLHTRTASGPPRSDGRYGRCLAWQLLRRVTWLVGNRVLQRKGCSPPEPRRALMNSCASNSTSVQWGLIAHKVGIACLSFRRGVSLQAEF
jgi:hypothetical protein